MPTAPTTPQVLLYKDIKDHLGVMDEAYKMLARINKRLTEDLEAVSSNPAYPQEVKEALGSLSIDFNAIRAKLRSSAQHLYQISEDEYA